MAEKAGKVAQASRGKGGGKGGGKGITKARKNVTKTLAMWEVALAKAYTSHNAHKQAVTEAHEAEETFHAALSKAKKLGKRSVLDLKRAKAFEVSWKTD